MISWDMDDGNQSSKAEARFKIGDEVVDPVSGLQGTVVRDCSGV